MRTKVKQVRSNENEGLCKKDCFRLGTKSAFLGVPAAAISVFDERPAQSCGVTRADAKLLISLND